MNALIDFNENNSVLNEYSSGLPSFVAASCSILRYHWA